MFKVTINKTQPTIDEKEQMTSGSRNCFVAEFEFSSEWKTMSRTAVFKAGDTIINVLLDDSNRCFIPWEVLAEAGKTLQIGAFGLIGEDTILTTTWINVDTIAQGVESGVLSSEPTPGVYQQILSDISDIRKEIEDLKNEPTTPDNPSPSNPTDSKDYWWNPQMTSQSSNGCTTVSSGTNTSGGFYAFSQKAFDGNPDSCWSADKFGSETPYIGIYLGASEIPDEAIPIIKGFRFVPYKGDDNAYKNAFPTQITIRGKETGDSTSEFKDITVVNLPSERVYTILLDSPVRYRNYRFFATGLPLSTDNVVTIGDIWFYGPGPYHDGWYVDDPDKVRDLDPYSLQEEVVGTWIDGRPIYQVVVYSNAYVKLTKGSVDTVIFKYPRADSSRNISMDIYSEGHPLNGRCLTDGNGVPNAIVGYWINYSPGSINVHFKAFGEPDDWSGQNFYIDYAKIRYYKHADKPVLGVWSPKSTSIRDPYDITGTDYDPEHDLYMAFDSDPETYFLWVGSSFTSMQEVFCAIDLKKPKRVFGAYIKPVVSEENPDLEKGLPTKASMYGSNDGENWILLGDGVSNDTNRIYPIDIKFAGDSVSVGCYIYRYYKFAGFENGRSEQSKNCIIGDIWFKVREEEANGD